LLLKNNGFVITSDAFLGLTLLFLLILVSLSYISQVSFVAWNNIDLINSARDLSIVLDKSNVFENSILLNSSELLLDELNSTPNSFCFEINIVPENSSVPVLSVLKTGCSKNFDELIVVNRSIIVNNNNVFSFFVVKTEAWFK
jgi:hypothetical protein